MKTIKLTKGYVAIVSDCFYENLNRYKWCTYLMRGKPYAARKTRDLSGKQHTIYMHREILGLAVGDKSLVDHVNGETLNNRIENLRQCSNSQNLMNSSCHRDSLSSYKGVSWHKFKQKWRVSIFVNGHSKHIGYFENEYEAAKAYDKSAITYFKEFAKTNFVYSSRKSA